MSPPRPPTRRRLLRAGAGAALALSLSGCLAGGDPSDESDPMAERPYPTDLVGDDAYADAFADAVEERRFPDPDADLLPAVTKARFVAEASRAAGESAFADEIASSRDPLFEPFLQFEAVSALASERRRERLDEERIDELTEQAGLDEADATLEDDPETIVRATLDERALTFFDYPGPPLHVIEGSESRGTESLDEGPDQRAAAVEEEHRTYVRQRARIEAVVVGAREIAIEAYDEAIDRIREQSPSTYTYESETAYGEVVAFNAALAAEYMLAEDGEIVTPP